MPGSTTVPHPPPSPASSSAAKIDVEAGSNAISPDIDRLEREISEHIVMAIERTPLETEPFPHIFIEGFFPEAIYEELLANLPKDDFYQPLIHRDSVRPDGSSPRIQASLSEDRLPKLPKGRCRDLWTAATRSAQDEKVKMALLQKLEPGIRERHLQPLEEIEAFSRPALNRDVAGYKILPHPDTKAKIMSGLIYFPVNETQGELGTSLYVRRLMPLGMKPRFDCVKTVPFAANSGVIFAVTKRSFHGREPIPDSSDTRNYFALTYYDDPTRRGY
jgi:hypothetical protein